MRDHFKLSNLRYWLRQLSSLIYLLPIMALITAVLCFLVIFPTLSPDEGLYSQSKGHIMVEVISPHFENDIKGRRGVWVALGKTETGELWPLIRHEETPFEAGSIIEVELRCQGIDFTFCKGFDVPASKVRN